MTGGQALQDLRPRRPFADAADEVLDDFEVDVGLQQRQSHLTHGGIDVVGAYSTVTGQSAERRAQAVAQSVEHG